MMQALELLWLVKKTLNSEEIEPIVIAIIDLRLSEGIREGRSQSVSQSVSQ